MKLKLRLWLFPFIFAAFLLYTVLSTEEPLILSPSLKPLASKSKHCLLAPWTGSSLAPYHTLFLRSISPSARLIIIHESHLNTSLLAHFNIQSINIGPSLPRYVAKQICSLGCSNNDPSWCNKDCTSLETALAKADDHTWGSAVAQYRILFGAVFHDHLKHCSSWGYMDHDIIFGSLPDITVNEIVGLPDQIHNGLFLPGQLTLHQNIPSLTTLWKHCGLINTLDKMVSTFSGESSFYAMDEGCYFDGVMKSKTKVTLIPLQGNPGGYEYIVWTSGEVFLVSSNDSISDLSSLSKPKHKVLDKPIKIGWKTELIQCSSWIPLEYNHCRNDFDTHPALKQYRQDYDLEHSIYTITKGELYLTTLVENRGRSVEVSFVHMPESLKSILDFDEYREEKAVFVVRIGDGKVFSFDTLNEAGSVLN